MMRSDDVPSFVRAKWADQVMKSAFMRAQIIADTLGSKWGDLSAVEAKAALLCVRTADLTTLKLFCTPHSIREPVAAGATRFCDFIEEGPEQARARRLMLVVDAGAGTTDFALLQSFVDPSTEELLFALISNAVGMSRVAGNRFDLVLRPLILKACKIQPENGTPWGDEEFSIIKTDLSSQIRQLKQQLFAIDSISISLRPGASGLLTLKELENEVAYQELGRNLIDQRDLLLRNAFEGSVEGFREINSRVGRPVPIYVLLTGGSARFHQYKHWQMAASALGVQSSNLSPLRTCLAGFKSSPEIYPNCLPASILSAPLLLVDLLLSCPGSGPTLLVQ
jgi:hypothetical protein